MSLYLSFAGSLLANIWSAYVRPELDRESEGTLLDPTVDGSSRDPERTADEDAIYLAILNSPVPF